MKLKKSMLVLAITFGLTVASPAFATDATPSPSDSPSMSRADTLALIQDQYITELNSELARFLAVKKIFQTDPASLAAFNKVLKDPEVRKSLQGIGAQVDGGSVAEFTKFSQSEIKRYEGIVKMSGAPKE